MLVNLVLTELLVSLYGIPVDLVAALQGGWFMGEKLCIITGFILTLLGRNIRDKLGLNWAKLSFNFCGLYQILKYLFI